MARPKEYFRDLPVCPETGKLSFPTKKLPREFKYVGHQGQLISIGTYRCKICPYFHQSRQH